LAIWAKQYELKPFLPACQLSLLRCRILTWHQTLFPTLYDEYEKHTSSKAFTVKSHKSFRGAIFSSLPLTSIDASKNAPIRQSQFQTQFVSRQTHSGRSDSRDFSKLNPPLRFIFFCSFTNMILPIRFY